MEIDVTGIMNDIRADIEQRKLDGTLTPFEEVPTRQGESGMDPVGFYEEAELDDALLAAHNARTVAADHAVSGGRVSTFAKRAVRKAIRFIVEPIVADQNEFNESAVRALDQLKLKADAQEARIAELEARLAEMEARPAEPEARLSELEKEQ